MSIEAKVIVNDGVIERLGRTFLNDDSAIFRVRKNVAYIVANYDYKSSEIVFDAGNGATAVVEFFVENDPDAFIDFIIHDYGKEFTIFAMNGDVVNIFADETVYEL